ncbi:MAG: S-layer homology domain-containing protein [Butyricicoccus sp.]
MKFLSKTALCACALAAICAASASAANFSDIAADTDAGKAINKMADAGILAGYPDGTFQPNKGLTRAEFVQIANLTFGIQLTDETPLAFTDVPSTHWAYERIRAAYKAGYIAGVGNNKFAPDGVLTREQVAAMVDRIQKFENLAGLKITITDPVSAWARESVEDAIACGLFTLPEDGTFRGTQAITRAEVCQALAQYVSDTPSTSDNTGAGGSISGGGGAGGGGGGSSTSENSNTPANVVTALKDASNALGKIHYEGPMMSEIITTMKTCVDDVLVRESQGTTITSEYVKTTYKTQIDRVQELYDGLVPENQDRIQQDIVQNVEKVSTINILQEYFLS